ncbi:hypothetical protein Thena_0103 [Thermodesulfobium narugense DSM 14796]|uniref:Uncharacterized protein n=1 Tax=Thermodesulfobium narugense DSM 14796 TaxID=747365 RepID=M1E6W5_9BACT|nr:hypothetical protein Thena_0103 [Thermodesulfobium narugense DSM 14796]
MKRVLLVIDVQEVRERKYKYIIEKNFPDSFANTEQF